MATNFKLSNAAASACAGNGVNLGLLPLLAGAKIHLYDGTQPTHPDIAIGTSYNDFCSAVPVTLASPAGTVSNGVITMGTVTSGTCTYTGTPTWFRIYASDGSTVLADGTVGEAGCDLNFNTTDFISGGTIAVSSWTITVPAH
jgi:hypothetical protein